MFKSQLDKTMPMFSGYYFSNRMRTPEDMDNIDRIFFLDSLVVSFGRVVFYKKAKQTSPKH